jgi:hypothetical protein
MEQDMMVEFGGQFVYRGTSGVVCGSYNDATLPLRGWLLCQDLLFLLTARRVNSLPAPLGVLTHSLPLTRILLTRLIGGSALATSRVPCLQAKSSDPRDPISLVNVDLPQRVGTSHYRFSCTISSGSQVPRSEVPRPHVTSPAYDLHHAQDLQDVVAHTLRPCDPISSSRVLATS